jgi:hypothetical protein
VKPKTAAVVLVTLIASAVTLAVPAAATSRLRATGAVVRTFSFIGKANSKTSTVVNFNGLLINARCDSRGNPVIFAFSSATNADLFGRMFDGLGRVYIIRNSSFTKKSRGVFLSPSAADYDSTGSVLFETSAGHVVTVAYAFDNSTTLAKLHVCTAYGSIVAS